MPLPLRATRTEPPLATLATLAAEAGFGGVESNAGQMGSTLEWTARLLHGEVANPVAMLAAEAEASAPGAFGMHSTIGAAIFNASAMEPPVDTLTFSSVAARAGDEGRADVARAILEGMAYAVRANVEQILTISGGKPSELWLSGGITRSALWTRLVSDVMGCPVHVSASAEATALGAAICAGVAHGRGQRATANPRSAGHRDRVPATPATIARARPMW